MSNNKSPCAMHPVLNYLSRQINSKRLCEENTIPFVRLACDSWLRCNSLSELLVQIIFLLKETKPELYFCESRKSLIVFREGLTFSMTADQAASMCTPPPELKSCVPKKSRCRSVWIFDAIQRSLFFESLNLPRLTLRILSGIEWGMGERLKEDIQHGMLARPLTSLFTRVFPGSEWWPVRKLHESDLRRISRTISDTGVLLKRHRSATSVWQHLMRKRKRRRTAAANP